MPIYIGRKRKRQKGNIPPKKTHPRVERINQVWSIDFISAHLENGAAFRCFNGVDIHSRFRDEFLNHRTFRSINHDKQEVETWRKYYNEERPHSSLNYATPKEFVENEEAMLARNPESLVALKTG